ncbi:hypothetical protein E2C01_093418 [Portunus trituberculatus]|uniref:Uncharacterized protein n=1 Tax=Portunus trituberculatus TaxID=210409 RepID=A0A5B7JYR0_PORTR|nr:hypothetical protein [Portunus trituberculatus]
MTIRKNTVKELWEILQHGEGGGEGRKEEDEEEENVWDVALKTEEGAKLYRLRFQQSKQIFLSSPLQQQPRLRRGNV